MSVRSESRFPKPKAPSTAVLRDPARVKERLSHDFSIIDDELQRLARSSAIARKALENGTATETHLADVDAVSSALQGQGEHNFTYACDIVQMYVHILLGRTIVTPNGDCEIVA